MSYQKPPYKPYIPRFNDNRPISKEIFKINNTEVNNLMASIINSANVSEILDFFNSNTSSKFTDMNGNSPVHLLIEVDNNKLNQKQKISIIEKLIKPPINIGINSTNKASLTPLHLAVIKQYDEIVIKLIEFGADIQKINQYHQNCLHLALIPNIQPCEEKASPEPIIKLDPIYEDKNKLYNEILSIFYNHLKYPTFDIPFQTIRDHFTHFENYYTHKQKSNIELVGSNVRYKETPIDRTLKDIQNIITKEMTNSKTNKSDIKTKINAQINKSIREIKAEYEKFTETCIKPIKIDRRQVLKYNEADLNVITDYILCNIGPDSDYSNLEEFLYKKKREVLNSIHDDMDKMFKLFHHDYKLKRRDNKYYMYPIVDANYGMAQGGDSLIDNNLDNILPLLLPLPIDLNYTRENILYYNVNDTSTFTDLQKLVLNNLKTQYNLLTWDETKCTWKTFLMLIYYYGSSLYTHNPDTITKNDIIRYYNMLVRGESQTNDIVTNINNYVATPIQANSFLANIINLSLLDYFNKFEKDVAEKINNFLPDHIKKLNLWIALDNLSQFPIYTINPFIQPQRGGNFELIGGLRSGKLPQIDFSNNTIYKSGTVLNVEHANNLNEIILIPFLLIIDESVLKRDPPNINRLNPYQNPAPHHPQKELNYKLVIYNEYDTDRTTIPIPHPDNAIVYALAIGIPAIPQTNYEIGGNAPIQYQDFCNPLQAAGVPIDNIVHIPNSFTDLKELDYLDFLKKRFIRWFIYVSQPPAPGLPLPQPPPIQHAQQIFNKIRQKINTFLGNHHNLRNKQQNIETTLIMIKMLDEIFIKMVQNQLYYLSIKKIKDTIFNYNTNPTFTNYNNQINNFFNKFIVKVENNIKLDKTLNQMVLIVNRNNFVNGHANYNKTNIIDTDIVYNAQNNNLAIQKKENNNYVDDYLVYYSDDYISLVPITVRQCNRNSLKVIKALLTSNNIDFTKNDIKGMTPIYYGIQSSNYLLLEEILRLRKSQLLSLYNTTLGNSPIEFAYNILKQKLSSKPDYPMLNVSYINSLLLSGEINRNIPRNYNDLYQKILYYIDRFIRNNNHNFDNLLHNLGTNHAIINYNNNVFNRTLINFDYTFARFDELEILVNNLNSKVKLSLSIDENIRLIRDKFTEINGPGEITRCLATLNILEQRYKSKKIYDTAILNNRTIVNPVNPVNPPNHYFLILISLGIIGVRDLLSVYYKDIILKTIYTTDIFNFDITLNDNTIETMLNNVLNTFLNENLYDFIRSYYLIKEDSYDVFGNDNPVIDEFLSNLLNILSQNGIFEPDTTVHLNIKKYVNNHMIELISKTLNYVQIMLDVAHRWLYNYYNALKTFETLIRL